MTMEEAIKELKLIAKVTMWNDRREAVEMAIEALQTDEVLCKDCANCLHFDDETENGWLWCTVNTRPTNQEDFCSFAERREP